MIKRLSFITAAILLAPMASMAALANITYPAIHFESDSTQVLAQELDHLDEDVAWLKSHPQAVVILEGHCDKTGKSEYNMELGDRRAREIKSYMITKGILPERVIMVVSFGENRPVDSGVSRNSLQKNRRVEFILR